MPSIELRLSHIPGLLNGLLFLLKGKLRCVLYSYLLTIYRQATIGLMVQIGTLSWGGTRKPSFAFTEQGVAMLAEILNSDLAIYANIQIIGFFWRIREMLVDKTKLKLNNGEAETNVRLHHKKK